MDEGTLRSPGGSTVKLTAAAMCVSYSYARRNFRSQISGTAMEAVPIGVSGVACQYQFKTQKPNPALQLESVNGTVFPGMFLSSYHYNYFTYSWDQLAIARF